MYAVTFAVGLAAGVVIALLYADSLIGEIKKDLEALDMGVSAKFSTFYRAFTEATSGPQATTKNSCAGRSSKK